MDRDGVINANNGLYYVHRPSDFILTPRLGEALQLLHQSGFLLIVVTNQGGAAKGEYSIADVETLHHRLLSQMRTYGVSIAEMYCCPHHERTGKCLCRKPLPLMVQKALARFDIDPEQSFFVGDSPRDIQAAARAGVCGILAETDRGIFDIAAGIAQGRVKGS